MSLKAQLLARRNDEIVAIYRRQNKDVNGTLLKAARGSTAKRYKAIAKDVESPIPVIWGSGGSQTTKMQKLDAEGIHYLHIADDDYSEAKDNATLRRAGLID